jgi:hypothetical protein
MSAITSIKVKVIRRPTLKLKVLPKFPANVAASNFVTLVRSGVTYTLGVDYTVLTPGPVTDATTAYIAVQDQTSGIYRTVTLASLLTSGLDADLQAIAALTSNGVLVRTGTNTWATRTITGTTNEITVTNGDGVSGAPTISIPANAITNAKMATMAAFTFKGNATGSTAVPTDVDIGALTSKPSPASTDEVMIRDNAASGAWKRTPISALGGGGSGVSSIAGNTGAFTLEGGLTNDGQKLVMQQNVPGGRLTVTSGTPVTTTDVVAATSLWFAPLSTGTGGNCPIYNGTVMRQYPFMASDTDTVGLVITLGGATAPTIAASTNYDAFVALDSGTVRLGSGPAWTVSTGTGSDTRGTGAGTTELEFYKGIWVNKNSIVLRYANGLTFTAAARQATCVGSFRTVAAGQTEDSMAKRYVSNMYNWEPRKCKNVTETAGVWTYSSATPRQANGNTANQLDILVCMAGPMLEACARGSTDTTGALGTIGIGINSVTVNSADEFQTAGGTNRNPITASLETYPTIGRTFYPWLEFASSATPTVSFEGQVAYAQSGISGKIWM